jgi:hypothetical protein
VSKQFVGVSMGVGMKVWEPGAMTERAIGWYRLGESETCMSIDSNFARGKAWFGSVGMTPRPSRLGQLFQNTAQLLQLFIANFLLDVLLNLIDDMKGCCETRV